MKTWFWSEDHQRQHVLKICQEASEDLETGSSDEQSQPLKIVLLIKCWSFWRQKFWRTSPAFKTWRLWRTKRQRSLKTRSSECTSHGKKEHGKKDVCRKKRQIRWTKCQRILKTRSSVERRQIPRAWSSEDLGKESLIRSQEESTQVQELVRCHYQLCKRTVPAVGNPTISRRLLLWPWL